MSYSNEQVDASADGGIFNFYGELPTWMSHSEISLALLEMDAGVRGIIEPPIATVFNEYLDPAHAAVEDYRRFYVQFESGATVEDMKMALDIVTDAIKKYRYAD